MERENPVSPWPEWEITEKIGEGSFGRVYKANRTVEGYTFYSAIKIISIPGSREEYSSVLQETKNPGSAKKYFENLMQDCIQEVSTMEIFRGNSHIVSVEDFQVTEYLDEVGWDIYIRMEYLTSFQEYCFGKTMAEEEVIHLGCDLAKALSHCHSQQIIHRDVKPENIFVSRFGEFKLGDFGIARSLEGAKFSFSKKGTYAYMAPEVYRGEMYTQRADLYSLGLVLYKLMNQNRLPFISLEKQLITYHDKENAMQKRMAGEEMPGPVNAGAAFAAVILKACAYDPEERYESAAKMYDDLQKVRAGYYDGKPADSWKTAVEKKKVRRKQKETGKEQGEDKNKIKEAAPWIIAIILVAAAAVIGSAMFMRFMLQDVVNNQARVMMESLDSSSKETTEEESGADFATSISLISERVTAIVEKLSGYRSEGQEGSVIRYYNEEDSIAKVLVYPQASGEGVYEEYYYWNDALIFAYIWVENGPANMYYYRDGMLIRWIDSENQTHDNEIDNEEFILRGDRYWLNSIAELQ